MAEQTHGPLDFDRLEPDLEDPAGFVSARPELLDRAVVEDLCERVVGLLRTDLDRAEGLAALAREIGERLGDDYARGRGQRAAALARVLRRDHLAALALFESALTSFERAGDRRQAAITRVSATEPLIHLGEYERARSWAEAARDAFTELGDRLRLARLELNLGAICSRQDRHREALAHYERGVAELREVGTPQDVGIGIRNLAVCLQDLNRFADSLAAYRAARDFCRANGLPLFELELECNAAYLHYQLGEYDCAFELFETSRRRFRELGDRHHAALCDLDQSEIYLELNLLDEAERLAARAERGFEELGMGYEVAKSLTVRAIGLGRRRRTEEALELFERARRLFVAEGNRVWPAAIELCRAQVLLAADRPREAEASARAAHAQFAELSLPVRQAAADVLLARLAVVCGEPEEALRRCAAARSRSAELSPALAFQVATVAARAEELAGDPERAYASCREAAAILEGLRQHLHSDEIRVSFAQDKVGLFESLVWLGLEAEGDAAGAAAVAFRDMEMAKSRSLVDLLALRAQALPRKRQPTAADAKALPRLRQELNWCYRRLDRLEAGTEQEAGGDPAALRERIGELEEELGRALRSVQATDRQYGSLQTASAVEAEAIRRALPADAALLEYFLARGRIFCCVLHRESLEIENLGAVEPVWKSFELIRSQLAKMRRAELGSLHQYAQKVIEARLGALYQALIRPLERHLGSVRHLVVVPHDFLHFLPFHALGDGEASLVDRWTFSYAPSASVFHLTGRESSKAPGAAGGALVFGIPDRRAPAIAEEARAVASALPQSRLYLGDQATLAALGREGREASWIHLATHGHFRRDNPMFSALQLGDGRLSLFDLYELELGAEMVVLSGCGTGLSKVEGADDLIGLARGILYAGARALLATLWDVNDESTTLLMRAFYRHVIAGTPPAPALAQAMRELRDLYPEPYHWAPFVLIGGAGLAKAAPERPFWVGGPEVP